MNRTHKRLTFALILVLLMGLLATAAVQAESREGEEVVIAAGEVVADDLYVAANKVVIDGVVKGDVIAFGQSITINGTVEGDLIAAGQAIVINGTVNDDARIAGQALLLGEGGKIGDDVNAGAFSFEAQPSSTIGGDLWIGASQVLLAGEIAGDVMGGGESVHIAGRVGGNVEVGVADSEPRPGFSYAQFMPALPGGLQLPTVPRGLTVDRGASIAGSLTYTSRTEISVPGGVVSGTVTRQQPEVTDAKKETPAADFGSGPWALEQVQRLLRLLVVGLLMVWLAAGWLRRVAAALRARPWASLGWGVVSPFALLAFIVIAVVAILLIAGLLSYILGSVAIITLLLSSAAGTVIVAYLMLAFYVGALVAAYTLGELILSHGASAGGPRPLWAMLIGVAILWVLTLIPVVGTLIGLVFALFGLGAIWLAIRRPRAEASPAPAPAPAA